MVSLGSFGAPYFRDGHMQGPTLTDSIFNTLPMFNVTQSADTGRSFTSQETTGLKAAICIEALRLCSNEQLKRKQRHQISRDPKINFFEPNAVIGWNWFQADNLA